jgi:Domain of unknown function (DUF5134)
MIEGLTVRWILTAVFAAAGLTAALPQREPAKSAQPTDQVSAVFCGAMCAALIPMTWWSEPAAAAWLQAALFGCAGLWLGLASIAGPGRVRRPSLPAVFHALMAGAMIWMLTAMPAVTGMAPAGSARGAMAPMSGAAMPASVLAVSVVVAVSCVAASIPWLARVIGTGPRGKDPVAASHAAMSAGMAAMLFATL